MGGNAILQNLDTNSEECSYCSDIIIDEDKLICMKCDKFIHTKCLHSKCTPGDLIGDVFFDFTCIACCEQTLGASAQENLVRRRIPWLLVLTLTLYNLNAKSHGLSHQGFFHWRTHIISFISKNWKYLFPTNTQRRKNWFGSVSGSLSSHSPDFFVSGHGVLNESGWWKLAHDKITPSAIYRIYINSNEKKQPKETRLKQNIPEICITEKVEEEHITYDCSRLIPYMGRLTWVAKNQSDSQSQQGSFNSVQKNLMNFIAENLAENDSEKMQLFDSSEQANLFEDEVCTNDDLDIYQSRVVEVTKFHNIEANKEINVHNVIVDNNTHNEETIVKTKSENKLVDRKVNTLKRKWSQLLMPISMHINQEMHHENCELTIMDEIDEKNILEKLYEEIYENDFFSTKAVALQRRIYRKLRIRAWKKDNSHLHTIQSPFIRTIRSTNTNKKEHLLDRYRIGASNSHTGFRFQSFLSGYAHNEIFQSEFTERNLHPFIYRNVKCIPNWVKLMSELSFAVNDVIPPRAPIDFCYLRPSHVAAVNALLENSFWPGIDMSECLSYPDYTVVALYKKLVIGCGFLVPDVGLNEAYISFMAVRSGWRNCGIGSFMLYHLIQTCTDKDITLHVAATNPAVLLYQKFGFKIEEICVNFYYKYLPSTYRQSCNGLFLRLGR